jgi:hypothetical protein
MALKRFGKATGINLAVLAGFWVLSFALVQLARLVSDHWISSAIAIAAAAGVGIVVSRRVDARLAQVLLLGVVAWMLAEAAAHVAFGIRSVQGGETHLTVMTASILGALLGFFGATTRRPHGEASGGARTESNANAHSLVA